MIHPPVLMLTLCFRSTTSRSITHPHWFLVYPAEVDAQLPFSEKPYYATEPAGTTDRTASASETTVAERPASIHSSSNNQAKVGHGTEDHSDSRSVQV